MAGISAYAQKDEVTSGGAYQFDAKTATIFPNPAVEYLNIRFENPIAKRTKLTVHNVIGNIVEVETENVDEFEVRLKVKDLPVGYYLLAMRDEETKAGSTYKFVKR